MQLKIVVNFFFYQKDRGPLGLAAQRRDATAPNADCPLSSDLSLGQARMNPSHHGSDEQMVGAAQQVLHRGLVDLIQ
jgi:hypothetical protein